MVWQRSNKIKTGNIGIYFFRNESFNHLTMGHVKLSL